MRARRDKGQTRRARINSLRLNSSNGLLSRTNYRAELLACNLDSCRRAYPALYRFIYRGGAEGAEGDQIQRRYNCQLQRKFTGVFTKRSGLGPILEATGDGED
jgi:hypothetical protein